MSFAKPPSAVLLLGAGVLWLSAHVAQAQIDAGTMLPNNRVNRANWEKRVLQRQWSPVRVASSDQPAPRAAPTAQAAPTPSPALVIPPTATRTIQPAQLPPNYFEPELIPKGTEVIANGAETSPMPMTNGVNGARGGACPHCDQGPAACETCGDCTDCDDCGDCAQGCSLGRPQYIGIPTDWIDHVALFAGVQGFKGPTDLGRNGNFGFHEGVSLAGPLGDPWGFGYQLGMQGVHSNFRGTQPLEAGQIDPDGSSRNQVFFTGGLFHRPACGGLQGGTVVDYFHDSYFEDFDLVQIRTEAAWVVPDWFEVGFWGAFGTNRDQITKRLQDPFTFLTPKDMYSIFYRRLFSGGGQGRLWLGLSGNSEVGFGGDIMVPLGTNWSLENNFTFLVPRRGAAAGGQIDESWAVSLQLVWYPWRSSRCVRQSPYYPLFNVADNSVFLVGRR